MPGSQHRSRSLDSTSGTPFRLLPLGDSAVTVEFGDEIDPAINAAVVAFAATLSAQGWPGLLDIVPTYRSMTVHFDPLVWEWDTLAEKLNTLPRPRLDDQQADGILHMIPVLYGGEWGPDLEAVATFSNVLCSDVITLHTSVLYRVYMLGFSPGFPYLGIVPERLAMPRLPTPRTRVPAGSVGIADRQTGIYPTATPGGWRLIGRTPIPLLRKTSPNFCLLKAGDRVQFVPIDRNEFDRLSREADCDER